MLANDLAKIVEQLSSIDIVDGVVVESITFRSGWSINANWIKALGSQQVDELSPKEISLSPG